MQLLFEDPDLAVINKPADLVVNQATTVGDTTVQSWWTEYLQRIDQATSWEELIPADFDSTYGSPEEIFSQRQGIVHRLDKDTSGALILAKNPGALVNLLAQFKQRTVSKKYTCLVHGKFRVPEGVIQAPVERASFDRQRFVVGVTGRPAETQYRVQAYFPSLTKEALALFSPLQKKRLSVYQGFSLVECTPKTGRTHQIRVHLQHWGHPIVGDAKYVGKKRAKLDAVWLGRQFLHASQLTVTHPRSGESLTIEAPLADDLQAALALLKS